MPNLWVALVAVAATAVLARRLARGEGRYDELVAGGLVAVAALFRPLDAVVLTAALTVVPVALRRATWSWAGFLLLGLAAGWLPWLVEMTARFGSPEAFAAAARLGHGALVAGRERVVPRAQRRSLDRTRRRPGATDRRGALARGSDRARRDGSAASRRRLAPSLVVPSAVGAALAAEYVVFTEAQAPRFLLPAFALFAIPAGLGLSSIVAGLRRREPDRSSGVVLGAVASVLVGIWLIVQIAIAARVEDGVTMQRASAARAGRQIRAGRAAAVLRVQRVELPDRRVHRRLPRGRSGETDHGGERADRLASGGTRPFLVLRRSEEPEPPDAPSSSGRCRRAAGSPGTFDIGVIAALRCICLFHASLSWVCGVEQSGSSLGS